MNIGWFVWKALVILGDVFYVAGFVFDAISKWVIDLSNRVGLADGYLVVNPAWVPGETVPQYIPAPTPLPTPAPAPVVPTPVVPPVVNPVPTPGYYPTEGGKQR